MSTKSLRALIVEDVEKDALLVVRELRRGGFDLAFERVDTPEAMSAALEKQTWDVVISDYSMPRFSAPMALAIVCERKLDLPFIIVSGTVSDDLAVEAIHAGAHDFMAKGKLARLNPAIERELRDVALRADQKKLQRQVTISERMASMGTLAAGVAHEINNPLASVVANLELAVRDIAGLAERLGLTAAVGEVLEELGDARKAADRIRNIVRDLKVFSRSEEGGTGPVDVHHVLDSTLRMAWNEIRYRARLVKNYAVTPLVEASESRLGQVFLNVIVNAAQAIVEGSADTNEVTITTSVTPAGWVAIEVADTGAGMPPEVLERVFTPFFTTKPVGVGTGLGLAICHGIVTGFGGSIALRSEVGHGTVVLISLPPARAEALAKPAPAEAECGGVRRGRVLVIDDEPMITLAIQRTLAGDHAVVAVGSGIDALERISAGERFDVILCDVVMPQMTGGDLHAALSRVAPDQASRMVFLTGGAFTAGTREFLATTPNQTIAKPFDTQAMRTLVNNKIRSIDA